MGSKQTQNSSTNCMVCLNPADSGKSYVLSKSKTHCNTLLSDKVLDIAIYNSTEIRSLEGIDAVCRKCYNDLNVIEHLEQRLHKLKTDFGKRLSQNHAELTQPFKTDNNTSIPPDTDVNQYSNYAPDRPAENIVKHNLCITENSSRKRKLRSDRSSTPEKKHDFALPENNFHERKQRNDATLKRRAIHLGRTETRSHEIVTHKRLPFRKRRIRKPVKRYIEEQEQIDRSPTKISVVPLESLKKGKMGMSKMKEEAKHRHPVIILRRLEESFAAAGTSEMEQILVNASTSISEIEEEILLPANVSVPEESSSDNVETYTNEIEPLMELSEPILQRAHRCTRCNNNFLDSQSYMIHVENGDCVAMDESINEQFQTGINTCKIYVCTIPECRIEFQSLEEYESHLKEHPFTKGFTCFVRNDTITKEMLDEDCTDNELVCNICKNEYSTKKSVRFHIERTHSGMRTFICPEYGCNYSAFRYYELQRHSIVHTNELKHKCQICEKSYQSSSVLRKHLKSIHFVSVNLIKNPSSHDRDDTPDQNTDNDENRESGDLIEINGVQQDSVLQFYCQYKECTESFTDLESFCQHSATHKPHECHCCDERFFVKHHLIVHKIQEHNTNIPHLKCNLCTAIYFTRKLMRSHYCRRHATKCLFCDVKGCYYVSTDLSDLSNHAKTHSETDSTEFQCLQCSEIFPTRTSLKQHAELLGHFTAVYDSKDDIFRDEIMDKEKKLGQSEKVAAVRDQRTYTCDACDEVFLRLLDYSKHNKKNCPNGGPTDRKKAVIGPYLCEECGMMFVSRSSFQAHLWKHQGIIMFTCSICNKGFNLKGQHKEHMKLVHGNEKRLQCDQCEKRFNYEVSLNVHLASKHNIYTSKRIFTCEHCDKVFVTSSLMKTHVKRYHTHEKSYACRCDEICRQSFITSHERKMHELTHTKDYPHRCTECDKGFGNKYELQRHIQRMHVIPIGQNSDKKSHMKIMKSSLKQIAPVPELESSISTLPEGSEEESMISDLITNGDVVLEISNEEPAYMKDECVAEEEVASEIMYFEEDIIPSGIDDAQYFTVINNDGVEEALEYLVIDDGNIIAVYNE